MRVTGLRCEYAKEPLAVDEKTPRFSWETESGAVGVTQISYALAVTDDFGKISDRSRLLSRRGEKKSAESVAVPYEGKALKPFTRYYWRVAVRTSDGETALSDVASFVTGRLSSRWPAKWIGKRERQGKKRNAGAPSPCFFRRFELKKEIDEAYLFATARGVYKVLINGEKLSDEVLAPGWTDYHKTFYYQGYDVTPLLKKGENAVGVSLGDGWYFGNLSAVGRNQYGAYPRLFTGFFIIRYKDGTSERVITDENWRAGEGPVRYADLQTGEFRDGRMNLKDFAAVSFDESGFGPVVVKSVREELEGGKAEPIAVCGEIIPVSYNVVRGRIIFDMGQNMVGRIRLRVRGSAGQKIRLRYGEMLNTDKTLYTANLRSCEATDYYVLRGDGEEIFEPDFTIHGFRYVEIKGMDYTPSLDAVTGVVIHNRLDETGSFECNDGLVNKLFQNVLWGQRGNFLAVPTDCPQRDERLGWTGDSQIFCQTGCYNMYSAAFYEKYVRDVMDAQRENGAFTDIAPYIKWPTGDPLVGFGNAAWGDAGVIIPWLLYKNYNNVNVLEKYYDNIARYIELLRSTCEDGVRTPVCYGDWLCIGTPVPFPVIDTAYMIRVTDLAAKIATVVGEKEDAARFEKYAAEARAAFIRKFVSEDGVIDGDTQTGYALALRFGLSDDKKLNAKFFENLVAAIRKADDHITTGFVGVKELLPVLCEYGRSDLAYKLLTNRTYPSWLYSVVNGATTIWERWNSYTFGGGFASITMNSFNHYSLGSVAEWMYGYAAGIREPSEGWRRFTVAPETDCFSFVKASYKSPAGLIKSEWERKGRRVTLRLKVPVNTVCLLKLKGSEKAVIKELGYGLKPAFTYKDGRHAAEIGSGDYLFEITETEEIK